MRSHWLTSFSLALAVGSFATLAERDAEACGGCFHGPSENPSVITDHRMILSISSQQTTLYDQIRYQGSPASFAWVLPISGEVKVGLSADVVFGSLDSQTQVTVQSPNIVCPQPQYCPSDGENGGASFADASAAGEPPVTVVKQETVGPYETVQLKADDPNALLDWLSSHSFVVPDDVKPIITAYTNEHFGFLAMKLVPGASVQAMRPVRVTMAGASPALPLRMVAAGTGATVGITLWVLGEGRYEPQNFPWFQIKGDDLVWDFATESSNYATVRKQREDALGGRGWQLESSNYLYPQQLINQIVSGGDNFGDDGDASTDYDPVNGADGGVSQTADQVRDEDMKTLFAGMDSSSVHVTRMRSDLAHAALSTDLFLKASADQSPIPRAIQVTQSVNAPACPPVPPPPVCPPTGSGADTPDPFAPASPFKPGAGTTSNGKPSDGKESFSCASVPGDTSGSGVAFASLAGFFAVAMVRLKRRRRGTPR